MKIKNKRTNNFNKRARVLMSALGFLAFSESIFAMQGSGVIAPPPVNETDENGVNVASGQVNVTIPTVSIGGNMGLSHSISFHANGIDIGAVYGYSDYYSGSARYVLNGRQVPINGSITTNPRKVLNVFGPHGSEKFKIMVNGEYVPNASLNLTSGYSYESAGDKRNTLTFSSGNPGILIWTMPDGTKLEYVRAPNGAAISIGRLHKITYPNGKIVNISGAGVTTNTGFQLKPIGIPDTRPMAPEKVEIENTLPSTTKFTPVTSGWHQTNPTYIFAINNAVQYCQASESTDCGLVNNNTYQWPKVSFDWPAASPRALFLGESEVSITNAEGGITKLLFDAQDVTDLDPQDEQIGGFGSEGFLGYQPGEMFSPRLVKMKSVNSDTWDRTYTFKNDVRLDSTIFQSQPTEDNPDGYRSAFLYWSLNTVNGIVKTSESPLGGLRSYNFGNPINQGGDVQNIASGKTEYRVTLDGGDWPGDILTTYIEGLGTFDYSGAADYNANRTFLLNSYEKGAPRKRYFYDDQGNLTKIATMENFFDEVSAIGTACYPNSRASTSFAGNQYHFSACPTNNSSCNEFTCNKPIWTRDALNNQTNYTYHAQSGQVATVTLPADDNGVRPQTRYSYSQKYAYYYKNNGSTISRADTPLWLLTKESFCITSPATSSGGCTVSNDEVVITYDYGPQNGTPNNLLLRGKKVSHPQDGTRLTCYEYDRYGNLIGEILPKANKSSCS